jgi:hypothetical protein
MNVIVFKRFITNDVASDQTACIRTIKELKYFNNFNK